MIFCPVNLLDFQKASVHRKTKWDLPKVFMRSISGRRVVQGLRNSHGKVEKPYPSGLTYEEYRPGFGFPNASPDSQTTVLFWGEYFCPPPSLVLTRNFMRDFISQWRKQGNGGCWFFFFQLKRTSPEPVPKYFLKLESPEVSRKCTFTCYE